MTTDILSDEQIEQLLQEAEQRLRAKAGQLVEPVEDHVAAPEISLADDTIVTKRKSLPKLQHGLRHGNYLTEKHGVVSTNPEAIVGKDQKKLADQLRSIELKQKSRAINDQATSGPEWFDLPKTELTPQLKRDLQLIEMRSVLDPHRHYKKSARKGKVPTFSQVGTVIEGPTEWFSGRVNRKERAKNFVEETMKVEAESGRFKRKYDEVQLKKTSGKKAHYKGVLAKRKRKG